MQDAGLDVQWRALCWRPARGEVDDVGSKRICNKLRKLPERFWVKDVAPTLILRIGFFLCLRVGSGA